MKALFRFLLVPCLLFPVAVYSALVNNFLMEGRTVKQAIATEYLLFLFLYLYCRYLAPRHRALTEAFIYAFALPFSVLLTLMSAVFILDGRTTSPPKDLLAFAQWIIDFVADPISEMFALAGVVSCVGLLQAVVFFIQFLFGICRSPAEWPAFVVWGFLIFGKLPPSRAPFACLTEAAVTLAAKGFVAVSGAMSAVVLLAVVFPSERIMRGFSNGYLLLGAFLAAISFSGMAAFLELCVSIYSAETQQALWDWASGPFPKVARFADVTMSKWLFEKTARIKGCIPQRLRRLPGNVKHLGIRNL
ncbi:hypothetical protein GVI59_14465 [Acetobacter sicerae]|nr:hypothetical protein [Acetobacter sicerae]